MIYLRAKNIKGNELVPGYCCSVAVLTSEKKNFVSLQLIAVDDQSMIALALPSCASINRGKKKTKLN